MRVLAFLRLSLQCLSALLVLGCGVFIPLCIALMLSLPAPGVIPPDMRTLPEAIAVATVLMMGVIVGIVLAAALETTRRDGRRLAQDVAPWQRGWRQAALLALAFSGFALVVYTQTLWPFLMALPVSATTCAGPLAWVFAPYYRIGSPA